MSELEKLQRSQYQRRRKALLIFQAIVAVLLVLATLVSLVAYVRMSKETYAYYTENGGADYKVYLGDNQYYTEEYLDENHAYIATLIDHIEAELSYALKMDADSVKYKYAYGIESQLIIKDRDSGAAIFDPSETIKPLTTLEVDKNELSIKEKVNIDFSKYNDLARSFISEYSLVGTSSELIVRMYVDVVGVSEQFTKDSESNYVTEIKIPLLKDTVNISTSATVVQGEQKILTRDTELMNTLRTVTFILGIVTVLWLVMLILFEIFTRNNHIDYARKVKKLLSSYKSYIQRINNAFNSDGYQVLYVNTFAELLDIRDTLQMPVLMYENEDQTCSQFFIAAPSKIMYLYEIKVENLVISSSIVCEEEPVEELAEAPAEEIVETAAEAPTEEIAKAVAEEVIDEPAQETEDTQEEEDTDAEGGEGEAVPGAVAAPVADDTLTLVGDDGKEHIVYVRYRKSYMARLIQSEDALKDCYSTVKNELLSYKKVKSRVSWSTESFNLGRVKCAKLAIRGKSLWLYLNLDPKDYVDTKYRFTDNSDKSKYKDVPFAFKVKSARSLKYAKELIANMMEKLGIVRIEREAEDYKMPYEDNIALVGKELIRVAYSGDITDDTTLTKANISEMLKLMSSSKNEENNT